MERRDEDVLEPPRQTIAADGKDSGSATAYEPLYPKRSRDAEVAHAQASLKRELVRVYAQSCGASRPKS